MPAFTAVPGDQGARLTGAARAEYVRSLFARIVPRYDLFNTLSTFGQDRRWRRLLVAQAALPAEGRALDVATGTGAVAFALVRETPKARVEGLDFCEPMIVAAQAAAVARTGFAEGLKAVPFFAVGDALKLRFPDQSFEAVTIAFGMRNLADRERGLAEMYRVLKPGGRLVCLELTHAPRRPIRLLFNLYFFGITPLLGTLLSGDRDAYTYLPHSLTDFPDAGSLAEMMVDAGFRQVRYRRLNLGTIALHVAVR